MHRPTAALRAIGYWCDSTHAEMRAIHGSADPYVTFLRGLHEELARSGRPFLPDPERVLQLLGPAPYDKRVLDYLESGVPVRAFFGFSVCRCCARSDPSMGSCDLTDGEWVWPEGLAHYVRDHALPLPKTFVSSVLANEHRLAPRIEDYDDGAAEDDEDDPARYDFVFWHQWAAAVYRGQPEP